MIDGGRPWEQPARESIWRMFGHRGLHSQLAIIFTVVGNVDELVSLILSLPVLLLSIARGTSLYSLQNHSTFPANSSL